MKPFIAQTLFYNVYHMLTLSKKAWKIIMLARFFNWQKNLITKHNERKKVAAIKRAFRHAANRVAGITDPFISERAPYRECLGAAEHILHLSEQLVKADPVTAIWGMFVAINPLAGRHALSIRERVVDFTVRHADAAYAADPMLTLRHIDLLKDASGYFDMMGCAELRQRLAAKHGELVARNPEFAEQLRQSERRMVAEGLRECTPIDDDFIQKFMAARGRGRMTKTLPGGGYFF